MTRDLRIAFIGDSFVNGTGDAEFLGWTGRVCARARAGLPALTHYNLGIRRDTSADVRARWRSEAERRLPPACDGLLVFAFGANDAVLVEGRPRLAAAESLENFRAIIAEARAWRPVLVVGPPPLQGAEERIGELSAAFAGASAELGVPYLELCAPLRAEAQWQDEVEAGDGAHPGARGYALLAHLISSWAAWQSRVRDP